MREAVTRRMIDARLEVSMVGRVAALLSMDSLGLPPHFFFERRFSSRGAPIPSPPRGERERGGEFQMGVAALPGDRARVPQLSHWPRTPAPSRLSAIFVPPQMDAMGHPTDVPRRVRRASSCTTNEPPLRLLRRVNRCWAVHAAAVDVLLRRPPTPPDSVEHDGQHSDCDHRGERLGRIAECVDRERDEHDGRDR
jgi:hypothetical protein